MTLVQKLTAAVLLFRSLVECFTTNNHNAFTKLRAEILEAGVTEADFDALMNTIFNK